MNTQCALTSAYRKLVFPGICRASTHPCRDSKFSLSECSRPVRLSRKSGQLQTRRTFAQANAVALSSDGTRWWEKGGRPNIQDIHSAEEFVNALANADDKLVVVEFFATWCGSCRALYPKFCKLAAEHSNVEFLKVNFDENKSMCKSLNIKVLPYFQLYRGSDGHLESFSCSISKLQKLKDSIAMHSTDRCSMGPPLGVGNIEFSSSWPGSSSGEGGGAEFVQ